MSQRIRNWWRGKIDGRTDMTDSQLLQALALYEEHFAKKAEALEQDPRSRNIESLAHGHGLYVSGLTEDGLRAARVLAEKHNTSRPGLVI